MSQPKPCEISATLHGQVCVLQLAGTLDAPGGIALEQRVAPLLEAGTRRLVFDLHGLNYAASVGIGAILSCLRRTKAVGGVLVLAQPSEPVREVLTTLRLAMLLPVVDTVEDGVRAASA